MTAVVSAYPAAVDQLLTIVHAAFATGVYITEGVGTSDASAKRAVFIGVESLDALQLPGAAGTGAATWGPMGNHARDERFGVHCISRSWSGSKDVATRRNDAFTLFGSLITAIQADPSIGRPGGVLYVESYTWEYQTVPDSRGVFSLIPFTLNFRARI